MRADNLIISQAAVPSPALAPLSLAQHYRKSLLRCWMYSLPLMSRCGAMVGKGLMSGFLMRFNGIFMVPRREAITACPINCAN